MTYSTFAPPQNQAAVPPTGQAVPPYLGVADPFNPVVPPPPAKSHRWILSLGIAAVVSTAGIGAALLVMPPGPSPVACSASAGGCAPRHPSGSHTGVTPGTGGTGGPSLQGSSGTSTTPSPSPSPTVTGGSQPVTQAPGGQTDDSAPTVQQFLAIVNGQGGDFATVSNSDLLTYGNAVCSDFEAGNTVQQTVTDALNASNNNPDGLSAGDFGVIIGAATETLCPAYSPQVQAWAQANSPT